MNANAKRLIALFLFLVLVFGAIVYFGKEEKERRIFGSEAPPFRHDGWLAFVNAEGDTLRTIALEMTRNERERTRGLMHRTSMPDTTGMLFTFPNQAPRSFWMKNTHISLDIIYVDRDFRIVSISPNTVPRSEKSIPSAGPATYVVEVNAGFCVRNNIKAGDKIRFKRLEKPAA